MEDRKPLTCKFPPSDILSETYFTVVWDNLMRQKERYRRLQTCGFASGSPGMQIKRMRNVKFNQLNDATGILQPHKPRVSTRIRQFEELQRNVFRIVPER